jgi:predicted transcriptional regulator
MAPTGDGAPLVEITGERVLAARLLDSLSATLNTIGTTTPTSTLIMQAETFKQAAHALIDTLPEDASWRELAYVAALRASIQQGLCEADAGQLISQDEIEAEFGASA